MGLRTWICALATCSLTWAINSARPAQATVVYQQTFDAAELHGKGFTHSTGSFVLDLSGVSSFDVMPMTTGLPATDATPNWFRVENSRFEGQDIGGLALWHSQQIDVTGASELQFSLTFGSLDGAPPRVGDYFEISYTLNPGAPTPVYRSIFAGAALATPRTIDSGTIAAAAATQMQVRVQMMSEGEGSGWFFDDLAVTADVAAVPEASAGLFAGAACLTTAGVYWLRLKRESRNFLP